ncbi:MULTISPECIES: mannose-1-phosphate guanylyltransferase/mannose-6-phosphate isomerase [Citrobacter]|uniref:mannose-1-phosphate guanylyltransferase/mannose-6-phosphate isomerase n=1 Tax=Citrobacter TaxID=544 RepID=UPI002895FCB5|nr:mannose-1-phosphate guanylyltransferase/mannose-6-phosphate isomerase [Citrobacter freundii complex sp. 2023EL-00966]MDT3754977.1 mannose-1-phosphate guanylyltransferase/mannose-6-phosphate isomerase [Citrobacter freundii complex sp. 2023EL-00966]
MIYPIIMAGGSGTRLWPLSREKQPKQFLDLTGDKTMLQFTIERLERMELEKPIIICNENHESLLLRQLQDSQCDWNNIFLEPFGKNTAPAIAISALFLSAENDDPLLLILAADHEIKEQSEFQRTIETATFHAQAGKLVTFGIVPHYPETGYGYIKKGSKTDLIPNDEVYEVELFVEKPNLETATNYLESQEYLWNSGMFLFKASVFLRELKEYRPDIYNSAVETLKYSKIKNRVLKFDSDKFLKLPSESIDYAVMEKTKHSVVVPMDAGWSDVGSWSSLWNINDKDINGNQIKGDVVSLNTSDCLIYSTGKLTATVGLKNTAVINTEDALLVIDMNNCQDVKKIVDEIKSNNRIELKSRTRQQYLWGNIECIKDNDLYKIYEYELFKDHSFIVNIPEHAHASVNVICGDVEFMTFNDTKLHKGLVLHSNISYIVRNKASSSSRILIVYTSSEVANESF